MAVINVDTGKIVASSQKTIDLAKELKSIRNSVDNIKFKGILDAQYRSELDSSIRKVSDSILNEAAKMDSLGSALQMIAAKYREAENANIDRVGNSSSGSKSTSEDSGTDKRNWWTKFWDWLTRKEPDDYDTTTSEQEKAADAAMKKNLWIVLQDEKYSEEHWENASVDERKQILQDYMNEVIKIYGLQDVKTKIVWDSKATYTSNSITWGYYTHGTHTVTLNERALSDSVGNWDSYDLLETVSHELRHAYQHEAVDHPTDYMVSKETITTWKDNFKHYINSSKDYQGYRNQPVEVDARDFQVSRNDNY